MAEQECDEGEGCFALLLQAFVEGVGCGRGERH